ncbi:MAG: ATP-binding protein, partial [Myxococcales bacterium]|nr:ATP-binding protein [Myxococcales bacterium]
RRRAQAGGDALKPAATVWRRFTCANRIRCARQARVDVLILDDWGMFPLDDHGRRDLNELLDDRVGERATIVTSQLPVDLWHDQIGDPPRPTRSSIASSRAVTASC